MDINVIRIEKGLNSTLGTLYLEGIFFCDVLEDKDRGLHQDMPLKGILAKKIKAATAIPEGKYQVIVNRSARFKRDLPLLLNVPGYEGIRIHPGNSHRDTEGCLLPGKRLKVSDTEWTVISSRDTFNRLYALIHERIQAGEKVWCKISNAY